MARPLGSAKLPRHRCIHLSWVGSSPSLKGARCRRASQAGSRQRWSTCASTAMEVEKQNNEQLRNEESGRKQMLRGLQTPAAVWLPHAHEQQEHVQLRVGQLAVKLEGAEGRRTRAALRVPAFWLRLGLFRVSRIVLKNSLLKLLGVFAFSVPVILFGAAFYQFASGKPFWDGMIHIYGALYKIPGTVVIGEANQATEAVMNLSWLTGSFTFAILLGVVSEDITNYVDGVRKGNIPVEADNHTLILNWNNDTLPLLRQMAVSRQERDSYLGIVVILADRPKQEMDSDCHHGLAGLGLEVDTRTGVPYSVDDLKRVAAGSARTVLLLTDKNHEDAGKQQAAAVLGVQACRCDLKPRAGRYLHRQSIAVQAISSGSLPDTTENESAM